MTPAERMARLRKLRPLGYVSVSLGSGHRADTGWVPTAFADRIRREIAEHRASVDAALAQGPVKQSEGWEG